MGPKKRKKKSKPKVPVVPRNANSPYKFQEGDVVWCKWYSRYYRAIILRLTVELGGEHFYGIHYWKFAKSWDMTVSEERLLAWTNENNKFVKKLHQELYQAKKKKKLEDKLISEIKKNITENPIKQQYPFLTLTDIRPLLKGYVPSEAHHSAEESVQSSSSQFSPPLTFIIHDDHYELKNLSIKNPTFMENVPETNIEPMIVNEDCENQKMGLFKEFSSKEKDVINVLDNMRTNNMKFRSSSSQRNQEVEYEDSAMSISKEHLRLDDLEDDAIDGSFNDGDDLMEYEKATSSKEEEELLCDQEDYISKNFSVDHEPGCEVNNILTILNDEPCHINNLFVKDALPSQLEKNINHNENTNFDINALLITENNLNNSKRNTCIMEEDGTLYKSNISKKVENLTKPENILISKKSGILPNSNLTMDKSTSFETTNLLISTTITNNKRIVNDLKHKTTDGGNYTNIKKSKANVSTLASASNKKNQIDDHNSLITEGIISKDIISLNEHHDQSVIMPVSSIPTTIETNINDCEFESYEDIISKDISLNEFNDQPVTIPVPSIQTITETNINEVELACSEVVGYMKKPKLHKKQKNQKLKNEDIYIDQDELVLSNSQLGIISKDVSLNEYTDQSVIRPVPSLQTTIETNINEVELASSEVVGYMKKTKLHKKQKNQKLKNEDIYIDQDELVLSNSQLDVSFHNNISLNKLNHSVVPALSNIVITNSKEINDYECETKKGKKEKSKNKHKKNESKNVDIYVDQNNITREYILEPLYNDNESSNENDHSILTMSPISSTQINKRKIENEISNENEFNILKKTIESSSTETINKEKIDDFEYEIYDGNHVKNLEMLKKQEKKNSKNSNIYLDKDDIVISENGLFPNQISHYTSNENWSCGSTSSSTSTSMILNTRTESDDDIDGHTTDDDDQYVKNRKVSKKKLKQSSDVDRSIYELFAYDKSYSRAAKVKANEAISQMSKPPISKEKKNDVVKRSKNGKKKEDDEPWNFQSKLSDYNLNVPNCVLRNLTEDKHLIEDDRFIPIVPAKLSVYHIICDYSSKFQRCFNTMDLLLDSFNYTLGFWLLHPLEKPKHKEMLKRYPSTPMSQIYGLPHLLRFIMKLPKLFDLYKNTSADFLPDALYFVDGLFVYLVDEDYKINIANYDCVMPDYYRMAYS